MSREEGPYERGGQLVNARGRERPARGLRDGEGDVGEAHVGRAVDHRFSGDVTFAARGDLL